MREREAEKERERECEKEETAKAFFTSSSLLSPPPFSKLFQCIFKSSRLRNIFGSLKKKKSVRLKKINFSVSLEVITATVISP